MNEQTLHGLYSFINVAKNDTSKIKYKCEQNMLLCKVGNSRFEVSLHCA